MTKGEAKVTKETRLGIRLRAGSQILRVRLRYGDLPESASVRTATGRMMIEALHNVCRPGFIRMCIRKGITAIIGVSRNKALLRAVNRTIPCQIFVDPQDPEVIELFRADQMRGEPNPRIPAKYHQTPFQLIVLQPDKLWVFHRMNSRERANYIQMVNAENQL